MKIQLIEEHISEHVITYDIIEESLTNKDKKRLQELLNKKCVLTKEEIEEMYRICNCADTRSIDVSDSYQDQYRPVDVKR